MKNRLLTALAFVSAIVAPLSATSQSSEVKTMKISGHDVSFVSHGWVEVSMKSPSGYGRFKRITGNLSIDGGKNYYPFVSLRELEGLPGGGTSTNYYVDWDVPYSSPDTRLGDGANLQIFVIRGSSGPYPQEDEDGNFTLFTYSNVIYTPPSHVAGYKNFASDRDPAEVWSPDFSSFAADEKIQRKRDAVDDSDQPSEFREVPRPALWSSGDSFDVPGHAPVKAQIGFDGPTLISIDGGKTHYALKKVKKEEDDHVEYTYFVNWDVKGHPMKHLRSSETEGVFVEFIKRKEYVYQDEKTRGRAGTPKGDPEIGVNAPVV